MPAYFPRQFDPATGRFVFLSVPSGLWTLRAGINGPNYKGAQADTEITVNGADVQGIELRPQSGIDIPVVLNTAAVGPAGWVQVHLVSTGPGNVPDGMRRREYYSSQTPNAPGDNQAPPRFVLQDVQPGQYKVAAQANGGNVCVAAITEGGSDLTREPLNVSPGEGAQPLVVALRSDCASLAVTIHGAAPNTSLTLLAVPDDAAVDPQPYSLQADQQGSIHFTIPGLRPGSYHVYAAADISQLEYMNPDAMRGVPSQTPTLDANQTASVNFELSGRGNP